MCVCVCLFVCVHTKPGFNSQVDWRRQQSVGHDVFGDAMAEINTVRETDGFHRKKKPIAVLHALMLESCFQGVLHQVALLYSS